MEIEFQHEQQEPANFVSDIQICNEKISSRDYTLIANMKTLFEHGEKNLALGILQKLSQSMDAKALQMACAILDKNLCYKESLILRKQIVQIAPEFLNFFHLARTAELSEDSALAQQNYYEALALAVEDSQEVFDAYKNLGNIILRQGDFEAAEELYNKAFCIYSKSDVLHINLGTLHLQKDNIEKALDCYKLAVSFNPKNEKAWLGLAMLYNDFGDFDLAWGNLIQAIDLYPGERTAILLLARWSLRDQTPDRGLGRVIDWACDHPEDQEICLLLVHLFCAKQDWFKAEMELIRLLNSNPLFAAGWILFEEIKEVQSDGSGIERAFEEVAAG